MNFVILKNTIKRNWKLMLVFLAVLCFYLSVILYLSIRPTWRKSKTCSA